MIELQDVDLNLLRVFREVLLTRSVSAAARHLDVTQSAVSNALNRLRATFDDALFVRTADGMQATPFAQRLAEPIETALDGLRRAFNRSEVFDPTTSTREFTLLMTDVGEVYLMPELIRHCLHAAPHISLRSVRAGVTVDMGLELSAGRIDAAIGAFGEAPDTLHRQQLFRQDYLTIFRRGHPLARAASLTEALRATRHLVIDNPSSPYREINGAVLRAGLLDAATYKVPHIVAVPYIVSTTDLVATVPRRFAEQACQAFGLDSVRPPWRLPQLGTDLLWHRRFNDDAGAIWLRTIISEIFSRGSATPRARSARGAPQVGR